MNDNPKILPLNPGEPLIRHQVKGQESRPLKRPFLLAQEHAVEDALDALTGALAILLQENLNDKGLVTGMDFQVAKNEAGEPIIRVRLARAVLVEPAVGEVAK